MCNEFIVVFNNIFWKGNVMLIVLGLVFRSRLECAACVCTL